MELTAVLEAVKWVKEQSNKDNTYTIYSDSAYCVNICNDWIFKWAANNWINSKKQQIENYKLVTDLWQYLRCFQNFTIKKISGHSGIIGNELADAVATGNNLKFKKILREHFKNDYDDDFKLI